MGSLVEIVGETLAGEEHAGCDSVRGWNDYLLKDQWHPATQLSQQADMKHLSGERAKLSVHALGRFYNGRFQTLVEFMASKVC